MPKCVECGKSGKHKLIDEQPLCKGCNQSLYLHDCLDDDCEECRLSLEEQKDLEFEFYKSRGMI